MRDCQGKGREDPVLPLMRLLLLFGAPLGYYIVCGVGWADDWVCVSAVGVGDPYRDLGEVASLCGLRAGAAGECEFGAVRAPHGVQVVVEVAAGVGDLMGVAAVGVQHDEAGDLAVGGVV